MNRWLTQSFALVAMGALAAGTNAQQIGRLFSTPEERMHLDELRRGHDYGEPGVPEPQQTAARIKAFEESAVSQFTINGFVRKSSGGGSTWVNGARVTEGEITREGVRIDASENRQQVRIVLPSGTDTIQLKAGQKIDVASGAVLEAYEYKGSEQFRSAFAADQGGSAPEIVEAPGATSDKSIENEVKGADTKLGTGLSAN